MSISKGPSQRSIHGLTTHGLTPAEKSVLEACRTLSTANPLVLSQRVHCSPTTIEHHLERFREKFGARDTVGVIVAAYERGLLRPGEQTGAGPPEASGDQQTKK